MQNKNGFTLLEILLATVLLTGCSVFLLQAVSIGIFGGGINETELIAVNLAQEKVESIRNTAYAGISNEAKAVISGFSAFQREVVVITPQTNLKQVAVNV